MPRALSAVEECALLSSLGLPAKCRCQTARQHLHPIEKQTVLLAENRLSQTHQLLSSTLHWQLHVRKKPTQRPNSDSSAPRHRFGCSAKPFSAHPSRTAGHSMGSPGPAATGSHRQPPGPRCSGRPSLQEMRTVPKRGPIPPRPEPGSSRPVPLPAPQLGEPRPATQRSRRGPSGLTPRAVQLRPHAAPSQLEIPTRHRTPKIPSGVPGGTRTGKDGSGLTAADTARTAAVPCAPPRAAPEARTPPASRDRRAPQGLERSCTCANAAPPASRFPPPSSSWRTRPYCSHADDRWKREAVPVWGLWWARAASRFGASVGSQIEPRYPPRWNELRLSAAALGRRAFTTRTGPGGHRRGFRGVESRASSSRAVEESPSASTWAACVRQQWGAEHSLWNRAVLHAYSTSWESYTKPEVTVLWQR